MFDDVRMRNAEWTLEKSKVKTYSRRQQDSWRAAIAIPFDALGMMFTTVLLSYCNIAAIVGEPEREFFSWVKIPSAKPDFHAPDYFEALELGKTC